MLRGILTRRRREATGKIRRRCRQGTQPQSSRVARAQRAGSRSDKKPSAHVRESAIVDIQTIAEWLLVPSAPGRRFASAGPPVGISNYRMMERFAVRLLTRAARNSRLEATQD